jgi:hypothetical protein
VVAKFDDLAGLAFENDHHAATYLGCRNSHITEFSVWKLGGLTKGVVYRDVCSFVQQPFETAASWFQVLLSVSVSRW